MPPALKSRQRQSSSLSPLSTHSLPRPPTSNILANPVPTNLLPINLLSGDWQLPPQPLESPLTQTPKCLVQVLLIPLLRLRNLSRNLARTRSRIDLQLDWLSGQKPNIAIFVVMHIDFEATSQGARRRSVDVQRPPAAVPEVVGAILVCDGEDSNLGIILRRVDPEGGIRIVFGGVC